VIVCGVEIRGKEAILALAQGSPEESVHAECATKKLTLLDDRDTKFLLTLKSAIQAFALQNKVDAFVIKSRQATGPRAGGGITFKIETLFQLSETPVVFISPQTLAKFAKSNLGGVPASVVGYQTDAYRAGAWHLSKG
jgi:hypothetical protein